MTSFRSTSSQATWRTAATAALPSIACITLLAVPFRDLLALAAALAVQLVEYLAQVLAVFRRESLR